MNAVDLANAPLVSADGVRHAAERLRGAIVRTPLIENAVLNERAGGRVLLKVEALQHGGSFKLRGAYNLLSQLSDEARARGVLAWSSGNHAQGVAIAAKTFGCPVVIVMPKDAPAIKADRVCALGAEIVTYDRYSEDREVIGRAIVDERAMTLVPPYDHPHIIEGQGSVGLEILEQADADIDHLVVCCGGGGLAAGCATIFAAQSPASKIWISEPEHFDETWASIEKGVVQTADVSIRTICDAIATPRPGELTFPILQQTVRGGVTVSESDVKKAVAFACNHLKIVLEPGGAAALAAVLKGAVPTKDSTTAITLSGGNIDPAMLSLILRDVENII